MKKRIYYHDTDAGGVVYYANYLKYLEEARTEWLEERGLSIKSLHEQGILFAVRNCSISYRSPAKYGNSILCDAKLKKVTAAQVFFEQTISREDDQVKIVDASITLVCLSPDFKPLPIPDEIRKQIVE